jgi:hypothetical protein
LSGDNLSLGLVLPKNSFIIQSFLLLCLWGFASLGKENQGTCPQKECAPQWHNKIIAQLDHLELIILVGKYAQDYYLKDNPYKNLTKTVINYHEFLPKIFPLVHPSLLILDGMEKINGLKKK